MINSYKNKIEFRIKIPNSITGSRKVVCYLPFIQVPSIKSEPQHNLHNLPE